MGVNWAARFIRWKPHVRSNGEICALSHLHPFRFNLAFAAGQHRPARVIGIRVGFTCHAFTCAVANAGPAPELYSDNRETRAFDSERYEWSHRLKEIIKGLEARKCYVARREHFVTLEMDGIPAGYEYRVFFTVRRQDANTVDLIVQSAYVGRKESAPRGQGRKPMGFSVIVSKVLLKQPVEPP
jgi:hypothetical protein